MITHTNPVRQNGGPPILSRPLPGAIESHNTWIRNRGSLQMDLANMLLEALDKAVTHLEQFPPPQPAPDPGFSHT